MVDPEDKKILAVTYDLSTAINYLDTRYNSDGNLSNTCFVYLDKIPSPKNSKDMYSNCLEIFHNMKVIISLGLESRIAQETLDLVISRSFTLGVYKAFLNERNRAIMLATEDGKFADAWLKRNAGADLLQRADAGEPLHNSSLLEVRKGTTHTLGSALISKCQKAWVLWKAELDNEDNDDKQKKLYIFICQ